MSLAVLTIHAGATLQGGRRPGFRRFGVPVGGAFDEDSLCAGNALVGNPPLATALELTLMGGKFRASDRHLVAVVGAVQDVLVNDLRVDPSRAIALEPGDVLVLGPLRGGARAYLCAAGGLGSESGGAYVSGRKVAAGEGLSAAETPQISTSAKLDGPPVSLTPRPIRILPGPQRDAFLGEDFAANRYAVSIHSNRVGIRLEGPPLAVPEEAPSEPMCVGVVQISRDGCPVIIGPDGPTIGGYPKIACVIEADVSRLGQLLPGDAIRFDWVSFDQAREIRVSRAERTSEMAARSLGA